MKGFKNATEVVQRDINEFKRVYPDIPKERPRELVNLNKQMYSIGQVII
jgi:hypothetical protein